MLLASLPRLPQAAFGLGLVLQGSTLLLMEISIAFWQRVCRTACCFQDCQSNVIHGQAAKRFIVGKLRSTQHTSLGLPAMVVNETTSVAGSFRHLHRTISSEYCPRDDYSFFAHT